MIRLVTSWTAWTAPPLAQQAGSWTDYALWVGLMLAVVLVGVAAIALVRRMLVASEGDEKDDPFTLHGLRQMRRKGQITDEEFERAKAAVIARARVPSAGPEADPAAEAVRELRDRQGPKGDADPTEGAESPDSGEENP